MGKYFGTDGFRGRANVGLTAQHAFTVGRFLGDYFTKKRGERAKILVGKDTRLSSYMLEYALSAGAVSSGADVYLMHVTTTPSVSFIARTEDFDCGVMISASHNPYEDNGLKIVDGKGEKAEDCLLDLIEGALDGGDIPLAAGERIGRTVDYFCGRNRYLAYLLSLSHSSFRGYRVGLDCANGSAWVLAKAVFDTLGAETVAIGTEPNGFNINRDCGSTHLEKIKALVKERSLDVGFAFDGDGDRCICVDERGEVLDGDGILWVCVNAMVRRGEWRGGVVNTEIGNGGLRDSLEELDIPCSTVRVGDRFVYEELLKNDWLIGGERSGHVVFRKYAVTGDGIVTAIEVMQAMIEGKAPLSALTCGLKRYDTCEKDVRVLHKNSIMSDINVKSCLFRSEKRLGNGRLIVRPSGTEQVIRIYAEGERPLVDEVVAEVEGVVQKADVEVV